MSEPAGEELLPHTTVEVVEEIKDVDIEVNEEITTGEENEVDVQQDKGESAQLDQEVEQNQATDGNDSESQEEELQQQQSQDEAEEPDKALNDSQDTVQLPVTDSPERAIEDEEMPSMVSISSTSRVDESDTYNKPDDESKLVDIAENSLKQAVNQEKDSDSDSVCVIDDDDDDEQPNDEDEEDEQNDRRRIRHDDDEGEHSYDDEYYSSTSYESDEMDEDQYNEKYDRRRFSTNARRDDEEDGEEDEDEDEENDEENDDEYMDEPDFDCSLDDLVLRHSSNGLSQQQKERSASLQDLSLIQGPSPKKRHNVNPFSQKAIFERNQGKRKPYAHIQSKVKKYIDDLAEQRRISNERRRKSHDEARPKTDEPTEMQIQRSEEVVMACQTIKSYTEKTLKEVAESEENEKMIFLQQGVENGEISLIPRTLVSSHAVEVISKEQEMEIDLIEEEEKRPVFNGTVSKDNQNNYKAERKGILRREDVPLVMNGEDPVNIQPIDNLRTLSYDEYMKGTTSENEVVINKVDVSEGQSIRTQSAEIEDDSGLRIESVVSNYSSEKAVDGYQNAKTHPKMVTQATETLYQESQEINNLKLQLSQRNQQFESLRDAYQKTMSDNMAMRMELENLRKAVTYYQEQQESPRVETKVTAVQTEIVAKSRDMPMIDLDNNDPKLGVSAVSTQWSDSTGSAAGISMDPPSVTTALDESSQQQKTPLQKKNVLSRAFMTSTKILQTLSSITYGKTKVDKLAKLSKLNVAEKPSTLGQPNSKKRKASDTMDDSTQPTKIPHLSKSTDQSQSARSTPEPQFVNPNITQDSAGANTEEKADETQVEEPSDDDVKVYVYPEDEEGKEHSFLIQAKEVTENPKPGVRECGPYLLGNVEVYMTEMNGTINIWGKELSQTSQTTEDLDGSQASAQSKDLRQNLRWQSTPRIFNKHEGVSASTSKKSRIQPRIIQQQEQHQHQHQHQHQPEHHHCDHSQRVSWPSCHEYQQHQHLCCSPPVIRVESPCGCVHEEKRTPSCCRTKSMPNVTQNCCCNNHYKPLARRHSFNPTDDELSEEEEDVNRTLQSENFSTHSFSKTKSVNQSSAERGKCSGVNSTLDPSTTYENENDPLITQKQSSTDGQETKKRKKRVRGLLMDLLKKGCGGDCRSTNPMDKSNLRHTTSIYEPSTTAQHRISCSPNQPSCSQRLNEKCSSCCAKPDKAAELESQLEFFRAEMDKLRSRSDTLHGMIEALRGADIIN